MGGPDPTQIMLDQLMRVILMDVIHSLPWILLGALAYIAVRKLCD